MALPGSGQISISDVNTELGNPAGTSLSMGGAAIRNLFGVPSGQIKMSDGYGKSSVFTLTISSNQTNVSLNSYATGNGWDGTAALEVTLATGVAISSNSSGTPALTIGGSYPGGVTFINNGTVAGIGGAGGPGGPSATPGSAGSSGGGALSVTSSVTFDNNGTIAGGGGGGGGGGGSRATYVPGYFAVAGGGGGGGGRSGNVNAPGGPGGPATGAAEQYAPGGAGSAGTFASNGGGGGGGSTGPFGAYGGPGGSGGGWGSSGSNGSNAGFYPGASLGSGGSGGSAGYAVSGDSYITWQSTGTRLGGIS